MEPYDEEPSRDDVTFPEDEDTEFNEAEDVPSISNSQSLHSIPHSVRLDNFITNQNGQGGSYKIQT